MCSQSFKFVTLVLICFYTNLVDCYVNKNELTKEFILNKNLKTGVFFICETKQNKIQLVKDLKAMFVLISMKDPNKLKTSIFNDTMVSKFTSSAVTLDMNCVGSMNILKLASKYKMFTSNYYWLVFGKEQNNQSIEEILVQNHILLTIETELIWLNSFTLYDVYQTGIQPHGRICVKSLTHNMTHNWNYRKWKFDKRTNLQKLILNATAVVKPNSGVSANSDRSILQNEQDIVYYLTNDQEAHSDSMSKFSWAVFELVLEQFNFTVNIVPTASWGYKWGGKFDGMVALLGNGSADIAATVAVIRNSRLDVVDYTTAQIWPYQPLFILRNPHQTGSIRAILLRPLSKDVWICVFITIVLVFVIMRLSSRLLRQFRLMKEEDSWSGSVVMIASAIFQQGSSVVPSNLGFRITFLFLFIWAMLIYQFYTSSIVSALLSVAPPSIHNLADLAHSNLRIGFEDVLTSKDVLNRFSWNPSVELIYKKHVAPDENKAYYSPKNGVRCVQKGKFAFYVDPASAYEMIEFTFSDSEICDLIEIQLGMKQVLSMPVQKHSPYKKLLTYGIRKIIRSGLVKREVLRWLNRKPICSLKSHSGRRPVGLAETSPAFLLLFAGLVVSIFILFLEILYFKYGNHLNIHN